MKACDRALALSPGRTPAHGAICWRKTPSSNLLLILITDREPRLCLRRFLRVAGSGLRRCLARSRREAADVVHTMPEPPKTPHSVNLNCHPVSYPMMHCCNIAMPPGVYRKTRNIILNSSDCSAAISNGSEHLFLFTWVL